MDTIVRIIVGAFLLWGSPYLLKELVECVRLFTDRSLYE